MEVSKSILYPHGEVECNGKKRHKYILASVIVTDEKLDVPDSIGEIVLMGDSGGHFNKAVSQLKKYKLDYPIGEIGTAIISVSHLNPTDNYQLTEIE